MENDYISRAEFRQTLINTPFHPRCQTTPDLLTSVQDRLNDTLELLDDFPAADVRPVWIPVTERLPEEYVCVLVLSGRFVSVWSLLDELWEDDYGFFHDMCEVTHWMPLPDPPEGGADG